MKLDQNPVFRKIIIPWYDTTLLCLLLVAAMALCALFGLVGMTVAMENTAFADDVWVPLTLVLLSLLVIFLVVRRLVMRLISQRIAE